MLKVDGPFRVYEHLNNLFFQVWVLKAKSVFTVFSYYLALRILSTDTKGPIVFLFTNKAYCSYRKKHRNKTLPEYHRVCLHFSET